MAKARQQYFADEVTLQKENRDFAIQPELVEKLESIEAGAQVNVIETVKVNGEALVPDEDKAVDIDVPLVEDDLYGTDNDAALSARQGRVLYDYIQNIQSRGRFLSNWNCATGLAMTNPSDNPYLYRTGDYFLVSNVSSGTNYRPNGDQYVIGQASITVESETVRAGDMYIYDGTYWLLLINTEREIPIDSSLSTTSTNPVENRVITNALNTKQEKLIAGANIQIAVDGKTISATDTTYENKPAAEGGTDVSLVTTGEKYTWNGKQDKLIAGNNISIAADGKTISAVDTTYSNLPAAQGGTDVSLVSTGDKYIWNNKQDTIADLETIRSNASAGKSASDTIATYGDIVTHDASEFATAAQGGLADTAIQPNDNISELTNDVGYITDAYHDSTKQDTLIAGTNIQIASDGKTISATDTTYVAGDFDIKDLADTTGLRTTWSGKQDALTAGANITIDANNEISATDTTYTAGANISISNNNVISATDSKAVWGSISGTLADQTDLGTALGGKQDTLIAGTNVQIASDGKTISATDTTYTAGTGISIDSNNVISNTQTSAEWGNITGTLSDQTDLNTALGGKQDTLVAGSNIQIASDGKTISATDTTYTAGTGISIDSNNVISSTQTSAEWGNITGTLADQTDLQNALDAKMEGMTILTYGVSTWADFEAARNKNRLVYCKVPVSSDGYRMAFLAYENIKSGQENAEFEYYRSLSSHSDSAQGDEVYVYKLLKSDSSWSTTARKTYSKIAAGTNMTSSYNNGTLTLSATDTTYSTATSSAAGLVKLGSDTIQTESAQSASSTAGRTYPVQLNSSDQMVVNVPWEDTTTGSATSTAAGTVKLFSDTQQTEAAQSVSSTANRTYGIQNNSSNQMVVNVPWTDTTYSNGTYLTLNGTTFDVDTSLIATKADLANFAGFQVVATLPTSDIKTNIIYLLGPFTSTTGSDKYEEWIYSNSNWIMIGETSVDLSPYFNYTTQTSDAITEGSTNLFLTSAERTKLGNTSGTNSGDETKTTIQTKLGAATSSNSGYLTSTDWSTFNSKADTTIINDTAYGSSWDADTTHAPTKNAVYDKISAMDTTIAGKQATLVSGTNIKTVNSNSLLGSGNLTLNDVKVSATAPSSPTEGMVWYDTTNDQLKVYDGTNWNVTGKEYYAGEGIEIGSIQSYAAMQGPAPSGFHVPLSSERNDVKNIRTALGGGSSDGTNFGIALKLPFAGNRGYSTADISNQGTNGYYWSSTRAIKNYSYRLSFSSSSISSSNMTLCTNGVSVRGFKNSPVVPDSTWTTLKSGTGSAGIFWSSSLGLISLSSDGTTWITIADKNLGATTVWNNGDTLSEANCGYYYQRGNNYGFAWTGTLTDTSTTQVDAGNYGPGNYYNSSTFIKYNGSWDSSDNRNLWGGTTGVVTLDNAITNAGVLSVNGQTGNVTGLANTSDVLTKTNTTSYTPTQNYNPATKKYVDDTAFEQMQAAIITSSSQPERATEGRLWYDMTNKLLKARDGSAWKVVTVDNTAYGSGWDGDSTHAPSKDAVYDKISAMDTTISGKADSGDIQFRYVTLTSLSDTDTLASLAVASSQYTMVSYNKEIYGFEKSTLNLQTGITTTYVSIDTFERVGTSNSTLYKKTIVINMGNTTTATTGTLDISNFLSTSATYSSAYTPTQNYNPVTKKYVDDKVSDTAYASSWNGVIDVAPSKNAVYDKISAMDTTIAGKQATLVSGTNIKTINNTSLLGSGNISITAGDMNYSDFNWASKSGATVTLDLASTITPSADFTVNAPATIKDGQTYILRVNNEDTAYTMTLGTNVTNPFGTDITLTDYGIDQFVFLAIGGKLELQPEGGGGGGAITADTTGTETSISKIWVGTEAEYQALGTYEENVAYMTY